MSNLRKGICGQYYGSYLSESKALTETQMDLNATYIATYLMSMGWTQNAVAAILGNMQAESTLNPGRWQGGNVGNNSGGYGLVQWTPASKYFDWCEDCGYNDPSSMDVNIERILYELKNNIQWIATSSYNLSFKEFSTSTKDVAYLAKAFLLNYERPADQSTSVQEYRAGLAESWYNHISSLAGGFVPRLDSSGIEGSFYWYSQNPFYIAGYGLPNCTCYAWGRFWEISDPTGAGNNKPTLPTGDAGKWYDATVTYSKGSTPKLGAVICWSDNDGGAGHVAIVEQINSDGSIITSNSAYNGTFFYTKEIPSDYSLSGYTFQGFIYNPHVVLNPSVEPDTKKKKRKGYNFLLFNRRKRVKQ